MCRHALLAFCAATLRAETLVERPDLDGAKPVATCKLQTLAGAECEFHAGSRPCCTRCSRRRRIRWRIMSGRRWAIGGCRPTVDRGDPWQRLLLLGPKRPVVIDLAVFIDGQPFRESREAWIDELLAAGQAGIMRRLRTELNRRRRRPRTVKRRRTIQGCGGRMTEDDKDAKEVAPKRKTNEAERRRTSEAEDEAGEMKDDAKPPQCRALRLNAARLRRCAID